VCDERESRARFSVALVALAVEVVGVEVPNHGTSVAAPPYEIGLKYRSRSRNLFMPRHCVENRFRFEQRPLKFNILFKVIKLLLYIRGKAVYYLNRDNSSN